MNHLRLLISAGDPNVFGYYIPGQVFLYLTNYLIEKKCVFIVAKDSGIIYEIQKVFFPKRSLFIGNQISQCGDVFVLSPINPVFLFLPALLKMDKFTTLDVLIRSDESPCFPEIFSDSLYDKLCSVCDFKETCGLKVLRLNEEKLTGWLKSGVDKICEVARAFNHPAQVHQLRAILSSSSGDSAVASYYAENSAAAMALAKGEINSTALQNLAFQIVADKLPSQFVDKLFTSLGLTALPSISEKENLQDVSGPRSKKPRLSEPVPVGPTEDYSTRGSTSKTASTQVNPVQAKLLKKAQGTKSLMSFFGKK